MTENNTSFSLDRLADFLFEAGMLRSTPRTGYQFLGSGGESVAEHSHRTCLVGYVLACMASADVGRTVLLCLFHDFHEARVGDFNYVNHIYNTTQSRTAMEHATAGTGLEGVILPLWQEQEDNQSAEALLANDADQLDLILSLKQESDLGNAYADKWLKAALKRLHTPEARQLAEAVMRTDHTNWWHAAQNADWWIKREKG